MGKGPVKESAVPCSGLFPVRERERITGAIRSLEGISFIFGKAEANPLFISNGLPSSR
jgi:hypothetical protein